jgi:hypothetical protein
MQHTTPALRSLETVDSDLLLQVSGGCHKKCCPPAAPQIMQQIVQQQPPAQPQFLPQAAPAAQPAADPMAAPAGPTGDVITTNVSINGQPVSG